MVTAVIVGCTGGVGKAIVNEIATRSEFTKVCLITRHLLDPPNPHNKFDEVIVDSFDKLKEDQFSGFDVGICALGTTQAKSGRDGFYKVDHDTILKCAEFMRNGGCQQMHLISSHGADKNSRFYYLRVKGEVEEEIRTLQFLKFSIYRPSLLLVKREESRPVERIAQWIANCADYWRLCSIDVPVLAKVLVENSIHPFELEKGTEILENSKINHLYSHLKTL